MSRCRQATGEKKKYRISYDIIRYLWSSNGICYLLHNDVWSYRNAAPILHDLSHKFPQYPTIQTLLEQQHTATLPTSSNTCQHISTPKFQSYPDFAKTSKYFKAPAPQRLGRKHQAQQAPCPGVLIRLIWKMLEAKEVGGVYESGTLHGIAKHIRTQTYTDMHKRMSPQELAKLDPS